ncbi:glycosyltransferase, partial [bacterium]|nr:glycosyltransferase [bacterium]
MAMVQNSETIINIEQPVCSVCIANFNGLDTIQDCINSVLEQKCSLSIEIIIHDDASTDNSVYFIKQHFPQVILIESKNNVGFCISNNRMADIAKGKYILLLNNDATLLPNALNILYEYAENQTKAGILGLPQYDMQTEKLIDIG